MSCVARQIRPIEGLQGETFFKHLYESDLDGYIQIMHIRNGEVKYKNFKKTTLRKAISNYQNFQDIFITPNTTYNGKRVVSNIRQLRALYIDIDNREWSCNDIVAEVWGLANQGKIPYPTMVINSGRGVHLYWRIEHAPIQALTTWQELEDYLYHQLKNVGSDKKATDATRVLRLAGSGNSKNNAECKIALIDEETTYSMYDLREEYLKWKPMAFRTVEISEKINNKIVRNKVVKFFTSYSLHIARAEDILTLCKLRNYDVTGCRNMIIHCYTYWLGVTNRDSDALEEQVRKLNSKFTQPLSESEIKAILRCVPKAIDKFIDYEQGLRSGQVKRVSKGMRDKGGYWYRNETLIERLAITSEEEKQLTTIISEKEKYRRCADEKKAKQKAKRRNSNGLTKREEQKQILAKSIKALITEGFNNKEIAKKLNLSVRQVQRYK